MTRPKFLIVLGDDFGSDRLNRFNRGNQYPATPTIDRWFDEGTVFTRHYAQQLCSPTRASLHTGVHPTDHGIGDLVRGPLSGFPTALQVGLPTGLPNLPTLMRKDNRYRTAMFGKFHLGTDFNGGQDSPQRVGWEHSSVNLFNLQTGVEGYSDWNRTTDGVVTRENTYHTERVVSEAIDWINQRGHEEWVAFLAPYACHTPLSAPNAPPAGTYNAATWPLTGVNDFHTFNACIEALDFHLARFAVEVPRDVWESVLVIFITDNGTPTSFLEQLTDPLTGTLYPPGRGKDAPYDPGIRTPLIFYNAGDLIGFPVTTVSHVVSITDILPTILDVAGIQTRAVFRGTSLKPYLDGPVSGALHKYVYSEHFLQNGAKTDAEKIENQWAMTDGRYALVYNKPLNQAASQEFYDLLVDPHQLANLTPGGVLTGLTPTQRSVHDSLVNARAEQIE